MRWTALLLVPVCAAALAQTAHPRAPKKVHGPQMLPLTTTSEGARLRYESAMEALENLRRSEAVDELRAVVKRDPKCAQCWIMLSHLTHDPDEEVNARTRAEQLAPHATPGERLLIRWLAGVQENNLCSCDRRDERSAGEVSRGSPHGISRWPMAGPSAPLRPGNLRSRTRDHACIPIIPAALNELAYAYAFSGNFEKRLR